MQSSSVSSEIRAFLRKHLTSYLVQEIEYIVHETEISDMFMGLILVPLVGEFEILHHISDVRPHC